MKRKIFSLLALLVMIFAVACAGAQIWSIPLQYQPRKTFPSLQQKLGSRLGVTPFKDERQDKSYIGIHHPLQGLATRFESLPMPFDRAFQKSFGEALAWSGVKVVPISTWDGTPDSLKYIDADSVLTVEIKKFWTEGKARLLGTDIVGRAHLVMHLGVKSEGKVFTRNIEIEKEVTVPASTPERVEAMVNQILGDAFDTFFSSPY
jgi:hypothetical protein